MPDRQASQIQHNETAYSMVLEGLLLIQMGNNPKIIASRMRAIGGI